MSRRRNAVPGPWGSTSVTVPAEAEQPGRDGNAAAGTVTTLITVPPGIEQVTNQKPFTGGPLMREGDEFLRARLTQSLCGPSEWNKRGFLSESGPQGTRVSFPQMWFLRNRGWERLAFTWGSQRAPRRTVKRSSVVQAMFDELREINVLVTVAAAQTGLLPGHGCRSYPARGCRSKRPPMAWKRRYRHILPAWAWANPSGRPP